MMRIPLAFMKPMFTNGVSLAAWIAALLTVNMLVPFVYINTAEGQFVLAAGMAGTVTQMAIFSSKGFVRLLGIGHIYWIPLLVWLWARSDAGDPSSLFRFWIGSVFVLNGVSLIIDGRDVARYVAGERTPHLTSG